MGTVTDLNQKRKGTGLERGKDTDIHLTVGVSQEAELQKALDLLDGVDDIKQMRDLAKERYGQTIRLDTDADGNIKIIVSNDGTADAIDENRYEAMPTRTYRAICKRKASLFTQRDQRWSVTIPALEQDIQEGEQAPDAEPPEVKLANDLWARYMLKGRAQISLTRSDRIGVALGAGPVRLVWRSNKIAWEAIAPWNIRLHFNRRITDDGQSRAAVHTEIDDATVVVIKLASRIQVKDNQGKVREQDTFIGYWGRSTVYPLGRCCTFTASGWDQKLPELDADAVLNEYTDKSGQVANPLSLYAKDHPGAPEYPIFILTGTDAGEGETLLPEDGLALAHACRELDLALSRAAMASVDAAVGIKKIKQETNQGPPDSVSGTVYLKPGQDIDHIGRSAMEADTTVKTWFKLAEHIAENHDIPGYEIVPDESAAPEAGVALAIRAQPKTDDRIERTRLASYAIDRMFEIAKALTQVHAVDSERIPEGAKLDWNPGTIQIPMTRQDRIVAIKAEEDAGYIDHIEAIRQAWGFETRDEAVAKSKEMFGETGYKAPVQAAAGDRANAMLDKLKQLRADKLAQQNGGDGGGQVGAVG